MPQERTEAVVLRGVDFSESSRIVTFLCPGRGRLTCMAKGVKRPKSQLAGLLDTFNRLEIIYYWKNTRSVQQLGDAALLDAFPDIKRDLDKSTYAALPLEIAGAVAHEDEPSQPLYETLVRGLASLAAFRGDVRAHVCWQVMGLLTAAGFEPSVHACGECNRPLTMPVRFNYGNGVVCGGCPADRPLASGEWDALRALAESPGACPEINVPRGVFDVLRHYAARHLESNLRTIQVIEQIHGRV